MQDENYREMVFETVQAIADFKSSFFEAILNVILSGELKEWSDSVPNGESHYFDIDLVKSCEDVNVQLTYKLYMRLSETIDTLCNLNGFRKMKIEPGTFQNGIGEEEEDD